MARKSEKPQESMARIKTDRLSHHLEEVEGLIKDWIAELATPDPFLWLKSQSFEELAEGPVRGPVAPSHEQLRLERWKLWACHSVYRPSTEEDADSNHMLRRHLRSRALWRHHTQWQQRLNKIRELATPLCEKAARMSSERATGRELTEDYLGLALYLAWQMALGYNPEKSYSRRQGSSGVWYGDYVIEKAASSEEISEVGDRHWEMINQLALISEMRAIVQEWQQILPLQEQMRELAGKAVKSSDILYPCQFCRRLW